MTNKIFVLWLKTTVVIDNELLFWYTDIIETGEHSVASLAGCSCQMFR